MLLLPTCKPPMVHHSFLIEAFNIQFYNCPATSIFPNRLDVLWVQGLSLAHCHISLSQSLAHNRHSLNVSSMEEEMNGWISAEVFGMWALYYITKVILVSFIGFFNCFYFPTYSILSSISSFAKAHLLLPLFTVCLKLVTVPRCSTWQITSFPTWLLGSLTWRTLVTDVVPLGCEKISVLLSIPDPETFQEITGAGRALAEQVIFRWSSKNL